MKQSKVSFLAQSSVVVLLAVLPFHPFISTLFTHKFGVPWVVFWKEVLLLVLLACAGIHIYKKGIKNVFDRLDILIFLYIGVLILITVLQGGGVSQVVFWWRYDFQFLLTFFAVRHAIPYLTKPLFWYVKIFLISGAIAILLGMLVRFGLWEEILIHFGFWARPSVWIEGWAVPIYHGIPNANIRRFQGIFDGPNQAAFFLLVYTHALLFFFAKRKGWEFVAGGLVAVLFGLLMLTYSRSAFGAVFVSIITFSLLHIRVILQRYKKLFVGLFSGAVLLAVVFGIWYGDRIHGIILRPGSTQGHTERMLIGVEKFIENPLGHGLATSGPASRKIFEVTQETEKKYIPESWYVQQLVEWWIIGFGLFIGLMAILFFTIAGKSTFIASGFMAVLAMNFWLHTFESIYISMILFILMALVLEHKALRRLWK